MNDMIPKKYVEWLIGDDTGSSSKTIWSVMTGLEIGKGYVPYDTDDFKRCYLLLQKFPEWKLRLPEVAKKHPQWTKLVDIWDRLEELYNSGDSVSRVLLQGKIKEAIKL